MKKIYIMFAAIIVIVIAFAACSNTSETAGAGTDNPTAVVTDPSKEVVEKFYTLISQNRIDGKNGADSANSYFSRIYQNPSELFSSYGRLFNYFKNPVIKIVSIEPCQIEQPPNIKNPNSYLFNAFKVEYLIDFETNMGFCINDGINTDYVYLLKEKDSTSSNWEIWSIVNERNLTATKACEQIYKAHDSNADFTLHIEKNSPYYKNNTDYYKDVIASIDPDSIYISPYPHPFASDAAGYETILIVVSYDIKVKANEAVSSGSKHTTDYVYLSRNTDEETLKWKVWKVEQRSNVEAEIQLRHFLNLVNKNDFNNAYSIISKLAAKNDIEYMRNWIENIKAANVDDILVWEGPPGGDYYIDGYTFYHFRVDGAFVFKDKDPTGSDFETQKYIYMIKKENESSWYIYAISSSP